MLKREVFPKYRQYVAELNDIYGLMQSYYSDTSFTDLCSLRGYPIEECSQYSLIKELNLGYFEVSDTSIFEGYSSELGLFSRNNNLLLNNRYIIPVTSVSGDLISLIGYYPDKRKYITLPTPFFDKNCIFFNFNQAYNLSYSEFDGFVILVEGIFDCLSLRSIGLPCIATMGATVSGVKCELLKLFKDVLGIPDDDMAGRQALYRYSRRGWKVPDNTTMLKFSGGSVSFGGQKLHCKDMDNFVTWYEPEDVREILLSYRGSSEEIVELHL